MNFSIEVMIKYYFLFVICEKLFNLIVWKKYEIYEIYVVDYWVF